MILYKDDNDCDASRIWEKLKTNTHWILTCVMFRKTLNILFIFFWWTKEIREVFLEHYTESGKSLKTSYLIENLLIPSQRIHQKHDKIYGWGVFLEIDILKKVVYQVKIDGNLTNETTFLTRINHASSFFIEKRRHLDGRPWKPRKLGIN
jgi:hypothetical protein